jgi:type I restriction enzyme S subunit
MATTIRRAKSVGKKTDQRSKELKAIDKTNWKTVTFGEVCRNVNESEPNPLDNGLERYVGLEHIESGSLHITKWGNIADGTTFTKRFVKGNVLFGKRRAYLKKAAVAEFDGLCSGDILVFEPITKKIHPDLFPFLVSSDRFFDYAVKTSAGSLSPRTKFKDLVNFEFLLPPIEEQARLAELLWAGDEVSQTYHAAQSKLESLQIAYYENEFRKSSSFRSLGELGEFFKGRGISKGEVTNTGLPSVRYGELYTKHNYLIREYHSFISKKTAELSFPLKRYDIVFAGSGETLTEIGKSAAVISDEPAYAGGDTIVFRPNNINGIFLAYALNSTMCRAQLNRMGKGATIAHIYKDDLQRLNVPMFARRQQEIIADTIEGFNVQIKGYENLKSLSREVQKQLSDQIFRG